MIIFATLIPMIHFWLIVMLSHVATFAAESKNVKTVVHKIEAKAFLSETEKCHNPRTRWVTLLVVVSYLRSRKKP